jgi:hypothetical protein
LARFLEVTALPRYSPLHAATGVPAVRFFISPGLVSLGLRVYGRGMKNSRAAAPVEPEKLKPALHEKIERMNGEQLALLDRVLLQIEAEQVADHLGEAFDADHAQGKLRRVTELVRQFRAGHRYA